MTKIIAKLKRLKKIKNILVVAAAASVIVYIGVQPALDKAVSNPQIFRIILFVIVIIAIGIEFYYESHYAGAERFLDDIALQVNDAGYYLTAREESDTESYLNAVKNDLAQCGYKERESTDIDGLEFDELYAKGKEYLYCVTLDSCDRNSIIAYTDAARTDLIRNRLKKSGECVVLFICDEAEESAVELSKSFSRSVMSRYNVITVSPATVEVKTKRVYFLGNRISPAQKLVINNVMNCDFPLKDKFIGKEKLSFQEKLEAEMSDFNIKDFKSGKYNER